MQQAGNGQVGDKSCLVEPDAPGCPKIDLHDPTPVGDLTCSPGGGKAPGEVACQAGKWLGEGKGGIGSCRTRAGLTGLLGEPAAGGDVGREGERDEGLEEPHAEQMLSRGRRRSS